MDELRAAVGSRAVSASEATEAALSRAHALNPRLNAFTQILDDYARTRAAEIDRALARGEPVGPLAGVPIVLKDNICTDFGFTTCSSRFLERYASPFTATAAQRLIDAGAVGVSASFSKRTAPVSKSMMIACCAGVVISACAAPANSAKAAARIPDLKPFA